MKLLSDCHRLHYTTLITWLVSDLVHRITNSVILSVNDLQQWLTFVQTKYTDNRLLAYILLLKHVKGIVFRCVCVRNPRLKLKYIYRGLISSISPMTAQLGTRVVPFAYPH